ncbi:MAG TPA: hypothetical protein V6C88_19345 [Chroococcidiopsis sp.]
MQSSDPPHLAELIARIQAVNPCLVDCWQATAIIESLGYTDRIIQEEFCFPDALALGRYIYGCQSPVAGVISVERSPQPRRFRWLQCKATTRKLLQEGKIFLKEFSRSFVYAVPLIMTLILEHLPTENTHHFFPPELSSALALATIISLITSGGFVQMISRRGMFYQQLNELGQMRQACLAFLGLGITVSLVLSLLGTWFGFYRSVIPDAYLILANLYYCFLSALWMLFAVLSIVIPWGTPIALLGLTLMFLMLRSLWHWGAIETQVVTMAAVFVAIALVIAVKFHRYGRFLSQDTATVKPPRLSALVYLMAPYFLYGVFYFMFVFADRIIAGLAINPASGLFYAVDSSYQRSMDLALLNFLLLVPFVEYLSFIFIRYWYQRAKTTAIRSTALFSSRLRRCHYAVTAATLLFFVLVLVGILALSRSNPWQLTDLWLSLAGSLGYLLLAVGLLNALILLSLDQAIIVFRSLFPALSVNLAVGYLCAHLIAAPYAVVGLVGGAIVFLVCSSRQVRQAIRQPDRMYYLGGY